MAAKKKRAGGKKGGSKAAGRKKTAEAKSKLAPRLSNSDGKIKQGVPIVGIGALAVGTDDSMIAAGRKE